MATWVDRLGLKQTDIRSELEKLRKKYEREQQPPAEFPVGFRESNFMKFESLFPEFKETEKRKKPELDRQGLEGNPFRETGISDRVTPFVEKLTPVSGEVKPTPPVTGEGISYKDIFLQPPIPSSGKVTPSYISGLYPHFEREIGKERQENTEAYFRVLGQALPKIPRQLGASILQAIQGQGGASVIDRDWADRFIKDASTDIEKFTQEINEKYGESSSPIKLTDVAQLPQNIAYSLTSMGAGLGVGVPIGLVPLPGMRVAAWTAGTAASGAVAYSMTTYQIMQQYLELRNEESIATKGREITLEEEKQLKDEFASKARKYGLYEAIPEAISNLAFAGLLTAPLTRMVGGSIAKSIVVKLAGMYGEELLTETITQKGQSTIEVEAGLREGEISWVEAFKEIAPQTFLLTTIMGGAGQVGVSSYNRIQESLKGEIGGNHNLYQAFVDHIDEVATEVLQKGAMEQGGKRFEGKLPAIPPKGLPPIRPTVTPAPEVTKLQPTYENLTEGQNLVDQAGDRYTISKIEKEGVPAKWAYTIKGITIPDFVQRRPLGDIERYYKIEQPTAIPKTEPFQPEAGYQPAMIEGVTEKVVRPKGKGEIVQISMEEQLKLEQARKAAEEAPAEYKDAYYAQAEIEGLKATHETDPVAQWRTEETVTRKTKQPDGTYKLTTHKRKVGLDAFASLRERSYPDYFTVKQAQALYPGHSFAEYNQKGTPKYNHVPRDVALDELTKTLNMTPDQIADRVMQIAKEKARVKSLETQLKGITPEMIAAEEVTSPAEVAPVEPSLAEQVKAKLATEPVVKPPTKPPKAKPTTLSEQVQSAFDDISSELEAWRASLKGLRKDNAAEARKAIKLLEAEVKNAKAIVGEKAAPADIKAMRQQVMAIAHFKGISKTKTQEIFKRVTGKTRLTKMTESQLADVLKAIKEARPVTIKGKRVVTAATEKAIQSLKQTLINGDYLSEQSYQEIRSALRLKTDKYITPRLFIGEREAKELIRTMNFEAEVGLLKHETEVTKALEQQPELADTLKLISDRASTEAVTYVNKKVKVSPWWDMWVYTEKLQNRTGEPFYDIYRLMLDKRLANITKAESIFKEIMDSTPEFKAIAANKEALERVNNYLASRLGEKVKVAADMTEGEVVLAKTIEKVLFSFRNSVRYNRFMTAYDAHEGNVTKMAADIPNAPREDLREAIKIYESGGATQLSAYLNTKDWGVIKTGYEPHIVVNPKLQLRRIKATILPKGMLKTREGITFDAGEKTILDRTHTYIHRMLNLELEPYLKKLDMTLQKASPKLRQPGITANDLSLMIDEMKGTFYINEPLARYIARAGGYATSVVYLSPHLGFRNLFQNAAMFPDRTALINPANKALTEEDQTYFDTFVNQGRQFTQQFLLQGELGAGRVANFLRRISFMGVSEKVNNIWAFWAAVNKGNRALEAYQKTKDLSKFINASGVKDLTLRQQKEVLELMALGKEKEAVWLIGRKINQNTNMIYDRAQGAPVTMGTSGRLLGSLLNFSRGYGQRVGQQLGKLAPGHTRQEQKHAAKVLIGLAVFGMFAGWIYQKVTGKKQNPYNPLLMITWSPGGLAVGAVADTADVIGNIMQAVTGDEAALMRIPTDLARSGDLLIPFFSTLLNVLESLSNTKFVDRLAIRKVIALLKENYKPNEEFYQKERSWIGKLQHALFGGEPEEKKPEETRFKKTTPEFKKKTPEFKKSSPFRK